MKKKQGLVIGYMAGYIVSVLVCAILGLSLVRILAALLSGFLFLVLAWLAWPGD